MINHLKKKKKKSDFYFHIDFYYAKKTKADKLPWHLFADAESWLSRADVRSTLNNKAIQKIKHALHTLSQHLSACSIIQIRVGREGSLRKNAQISVSRQMKRYKAEQKGSAPCLQIPPLAQRQVNLSLLLPLLLVVCPTCS